MTTIVLGTSNPAKVRLIAGALAGDGIHVRPISDFGDIPEVEEDGKTAKENALKKALSYADTIDQPVFSMDSGLYFRNVPENEQPGLHVRRIPGESVRPSDDEMLKYYTRLVKKHGGKIVGYWTYAVARALPDGRAKAIERVSPDRHFLAEISHVKIPGNPLHSIQFDPKSGKFLSELVEENEALWRESVGTMIKELLKTMSLSSEQRREKHHE
ncbi:MAG: non-canonical purine NTP pyrophosphatase [Patescibacteria group bacterium]|jgi:hypothetical protein